MNKIDIFGVNFFAVDLEKVFLKAVIFCIKYFSSFCRCIYMLQLTLKEACSVPIVSALDSNFFLFPQTFQYSLIRYTFNFLSFNFFS